MIGLASQAEAKGKITVARVLKVAENIMGPQPPTGSATISGKLAIRGCFVRTPSEFHKKVRCPGAVVKACTAGRTVEVKPQGHPPQAVVTGGDGSLTATVPFPGAFFPGDDQQVGLVTNSETRRAKGLKIRCFGTEEIVSVYTPNA